MVPMSWCVCVSVHLCVAVCGLDDIQSASLFIFRGLIVFCVCVSAGGAASQCPAPSPLCQLVN